MDTADVSSPSLATTLRTYYLLTKPGIIRGNALTAIAGFMLGSAASVSIGTLLAMLAGLSLIVAAGCVCNNYIDRGIDARMDRTKNRALVQGTISGRSALSYAAVLGLAGSALLILYTNLLTLVLALFGLFAYVVVYGIAKRRTVHSTLIGGISGAVPPVVGYAAATGRLDLAAGLLFLLLIAWQIPHFYAIAIYRADDYRAAGLPVLPVARGVDAAKPQMVVYATLFLASVLAFSLLGYTGIIFAVVCGAVAAYWLYMATKGFATKGTAAVRWARGMFGMSLLAISLFCLMTALDRFLP